jgi:pimeloyl-ACP methyl ester carboxylesterase
MNKAPLVLLAGLNCTPRLWQAQIEALADITEAVTPDLTGHDSVGGLAEEVLAGAPDTFALAGLSMGGYVALEIMRRAPERVQRLALLDTQARPDTAAAADRRRRLIEIARGGDFEKVLTIMAWTDFVATTRAADDSLEAIIYGMAREVGAAGFINQQSANLTRPDSRPDLASISCPTLVLVGEDDRITPLALSEEIAGAIPGARLVVVPASGHLSALERPDQVASEMRLWLGW